MVMPVDMLGGISPADMLEGMSPIAPPKAAPSTEQPGEGGLFASIFRSAIQNVKDTDAVNVQNQYLLATGQLDNPASAMIAATKYELSVNMLIQFRNKALDAYSELTRMSI